MPKIIESRLIEEFKDKEYFTREELLDFYRYFEPELKEGTFGWRIYDLKNRDIIKPLRRGLYVISYKPKFKPNISPSLLKLAKQVTEKFAAIKYCIWDTQLLNEFMQHQTSKSLYFIEIEKGFEETLFYELKDSLYEEVFFNPQTWFTRSMVTLRSKYGYTLCSAFGLLRFGFGVIASAMDATKRAR